MGYRDLPKLVVKLGLLLGTFAIWGLGQDLEVDLDFTPPQFDFRKLATVDFTTGGKILVGGQFIDVGPRLIRLNADGTNDSSFNSPFQGITHEDEVVSIRTLPDGKILVGGKFPSIGAGVQVLRLNPNGSLDSSLLVRPTFAGSVTVRAEPLSDGRFLACGIFAQANGTPIAGLARFETDGTLDSSFGTVLTSTIADPQCYDIKTLPDGNILMTGSFTAVNSLPKVGGARLNPDGTLDASYLLQGPGVTIFLGENDHLLFSYRIGYTEPEFPLEIFFNTGVRRNVLASGSLVNGFPCVTRVNSTPLIPTAYGLADGRAMVTGGCSSPWNNQRNQVTRFNADSTFDSTLDRVDFGTTGSVSYIARQGDGKYVLLGSFTTVNGVARRNIVRLQPKTRPTSRPDFDFDGDAKADLAVYRPSSGFWYILQSSGGYSYMPWGLSTDKLVAGDYDNDGKADIAVFRNGTWYIVRSSDGAFDIRSFGQTGDKPLVGNFSQDDALDDKLDMVLRTVFVTSSSEIQWRFRNFGLTGTYTGRIPAETVTDALVVADLDGDSADEYGYFRDGVWKTMAIGGTTPGGNGYPESLRTVQFGLAGDLPVAADYDGDGRADYAIFRPSTGDWWINRTTSGLISIHWGQPGDIPVPADYDGDGKTDIAVYRNGVWWQLLSNTGTAKVDQWGLEGDIPIPAQAMN